MLRIYLDDVLLTQEQLDAVTSIIIHPFTKDKFKERCIEAMQLAGCPFNSAEVSADANTETKS